MVSILYGCTISASLPDRGGINAPVGGAEGAHVFALSPVSGAGRQDNVWNAAFGGLGFEMRLCGSGWPTGHSQHVIEGMVGSALAF